jgi:hypothetical protein
MANENRTGEVVNLALLASNDGAVRDVEFVDCQINGPAVIFARGQSAFTHCQWDAADGADSLLWEIAPGRNAIVGAVLVEDCRFVDCRMTRVGIAGPPDVIALWRADLGS